jgi:GABA permease
VRNPLRTEAEAFSFVLVAAACFLALALAAVFGGRWVAIAVLLALVLGIAIGIYLRSEPAVREPAVWERAKEDGRRRILVVADGRVGDDLLREEVRRRTEGVDAEVLVVAPGLARSDRFDAAAETARTDASQRVDETVAALSEAGIAAWGTVGDADPLRALREALRTFQADELIVAARLSPVNAAASSRRS